MKRTECAIASSLRLWLFDLYCAISLEIYGGIAKCGFLVRSILGVWSDKAIWHQLNPEAFVQIVVLLVCSTSTGFGNVKVDIYSTMYVLLVIYHSHEQEMLFIFLAIVLLSDCQIFKAVYFTSNYILLFGCRSPRPSPYSLSYDDASNSPFHFTRRPYAFDQR